MANLQNHRIKNRINNEGIGAKVKNAMEFAGAIKSIWETSRMIYSGVQAAAPYMEAALLAGL
jgi:hypothetical protein